MRFWSKLSSDLLELFHSISPDYFYQRNLIISQFFHKIFSLAVQKVVWIKSFIFFAFIVDFAAVYYAELLRYLLTV